MREHPRTEESLLHGAKAPCAVENGTRSNGADAHLEGAFPATETHFADEDFSPEV